MLLEAFHFDLCSEEMSVGRVRPYALLGRPDWDEAAKTLGPIKLRRVRGLDSEHDQVQRQESHYHTSCAHEERFQTHVSCRRGVCPFSR